MAVNVSLKEGNPCNPYQLLVWLNDTLQTGFIRVEQVCTGAAFCQLMNRLFPGSLEFASVRLQSDNAEDHLHNYKLLQEAFNKTGVLKKVPVEALVKKNLVVATTFLQWFKLFFNANSKGRRHHTLEARREKTASSGDCSSQNHRHKTLSKTKRKKDKEPNQELLVISDSSDGPIVISDDEDSDDVVEPKKRNGRPVEGAGALAEDHGGSVQILTYLSDIVLVCSCSPYCLYLFEGVDLDAGTGVSLVLVGYFDHKSGVSVVRLLDSMQTSLGETKGATDADAQRLIRRLKELGLALKNISVFYSNVPHPVGFVSQLRAFSPRLVSLCGLPGMVASACQAGLMGSFSCTVELIGDIHRHYSTSTAVHGSLMALFVNAEDFNPSLPISSQYMFIIHIVQRMVIDWRELVDYFKSYQAKGVEGIRSRLMDAKVKLRFLFLNHALEPLRALHNLQQCGAADVAVELLLASMLFNSCASSLLRPSAVERFLARRDLSHLHNKSKQLPVTEVVIGPLARDFLTITPMVDLSAEARQDFMNSAAGFFKAALLSLVDSIPEQLGDLALRNILTVQKLPENIHKVKSLGQQLPELGIQLGLICSGSPEANQLKKDCLAFTKAVKQQQAVGAGLSWAKILAVTRPQSTLRRLLLTLLAVPTSLQRKRLFAQVSAAAGSLPGSREASDSPGRRAERLLGTNLAAQVDQKHRRGDRSSALSAMELSDGTSNSSDRIDITTAPTTPAEQSPDSPLESMHDSSSSSDDEDGVSMVTPPTSTESSVGSEGCLQEAVGELVWGELVSPSLWPAIVTPCGGLSPDPGTRTVEWFGQNTLCQVSAQTLKPFSAFKKHFSSISYAVSPNYREAIYLSLQEAALRCNKQFPADQHDKEEVVRQMLLWAFGGFEPTGPDGFKPDSVLKAATELERRIKARKELFGKGRRSVVSEHDVFPRLRQVSVCLKRLPLLSVEKFSHTARTGQPWGEGLKEDWGGEWAKGGGWRRQGTKGGWRARKVARKKSGLPVGPECNMSPDYEPNRRRTPTRTNKANQPSGVYIQPDQNIREKTFRRIMDMKLDIEGFCLCCGTENVEIFHPLFKGSLCLKCKNNFTETLYRYDDDGYQSYCTVCCYGLEVLLCGNSSCCRSYCYDCLNILVGPGTFEGLKLLDPWICYLCQPHKPHGSLIPRDDWSIRVQQVFANNSAMEFEPHRVYPSIPANLRRPIRVLSLFDGIATGYLVLKELGFKVERYVASEVCEDSVAVGTVNHNNKIIHIGDVRFVNQEQLEKWGPFDLLIGGSPCNDLSIVNPIRKGLYEGSGRLFFEFYRILQLLKPKEDDPRPFFWLFENVVFMNTHDRVNICRFLECNPVLVDAVRVSPAHRARYFWGNIPGMSRPIIASQSDKLTLQECLEVSREARVSKVRTITTNPNSLKQGKHINLLPVQQDGREDNLWITELERIFGFPKHYTDVRNMNRQQRQKVLGKAWSVPVIRHLFAPLKDYFAFEELPTLTAAGTFSDSAASSLSSPASPDLQPFR